MTCNGVTAGHGGANTERALSVPLMATLLVLTATTACSADTEIQTKVAVTGSPEVCKHLRVGIVVYNPCDPNHALVQCRWNGNGSGMEKAISRSIHVNGSILKYDVRVLVYYDDVKVLDKTAEITVSRDYSKVSITYNGIYEEVSNGGEAEFPEIKVVKNIDGKTVELYFSPRLKVFVANGSRVDLLYTGSGEVTVKGKEGDYEASFEATVAEDSVNPIAAILGLPSVGILRPLVHVGIEVPIDEVRFILYTVSPVVNEHIKALVGTRMEFEIPSNAMEVTPYVDAGPIHVHVQVIENRRVVADAVYVFSLGPAVLDLIGKRYIEVEPVEEEITLDDPGVRFYPPIVTPGTGGMRPTTYVEIPIAIDTPEGTELYAIDFAIQGPPMLLLQGQCLDYTLATSTAALVQALNDTLGVPKEVMWNTVFVPHLGPTYALEGLGACLLAALTRYHSIPVIYALTGDLLEYDEYDNEPGIATLPLALWGLRMIAAGTGAPVPLVGAIAKIVQRCLDSLLGKDVPFFDVPREVLTTPPSWYLRVLSPSLLPYVLLGALDVSLPLPLAWLFYQYLDTCHPESVLEFFESDILEPLLEIGSFSPALAALNAAMVLLPAAIMNVHLPTWLDWILAVPSLIVYLGSLAVTPALMTHEPPRPW